MIDGASVKFFHRGDEGHAIVSVNSVDIEDGEYIVDSSNAELIPNSIYVNDDADDVVGKLSIKNSDARIAVKQINFYSGGFYEAVPGTTIYFTMANCPGCKNRRCGKLCGI